MTLYQAAPAHPPHFAALIMHFLIEQLSCILMRASLWFCRKLNGLILVSLTVLLLRRKIVIHDQPRAYVDAGSE